MGLNGGFGAQSVGSNWTCGGFLHRHRIATIAAIVGWVRMENLVRLHAVRTCEDCHYAAGWLFGQTCRQDMGVSLLYLQCSLLKMIMITSIEVNRNDYDRWMRAIMAWS